MRLHFSPLEVARFWTKARPLSGENSCWEWSGTHRHGYGVVRIDGKVYSAHRVAWVLIHGTDPPTTVRHSCDNPGCVNPKHLLAGTQAENVEDMMERGRNRSVGRPGTAHHAVRLTEDQVHEIYESTERQALVAARFGISQGHVSDIKTGKRWSHITGASP